MTDKIYGSSVLPQDEEIIDNEEMKNDYTDDDVANARDELKKEYNGEKIEEHITTDAISGSVVSKPTEEDNLDKYTEENDIRGKTISPSAISFVKSTTGVDITDRGPAIAEYFETLGNVDRKTAFDTEDPANLSKLLGNEVLDSINKITNYDSEDTANVIRRLFSQIYSSYIQQVNEVDDIRELSMLAHNFKKYTAEYKESLRKDENGNPIPFDKDKDGPLEETLTALTNAKEWADKYVEETKKIDARNKLLKPDFSIDDLDPIKEALTDAINMVSLNNYLERESERMKIEFNNANDRMTVMANWITDIKNDPTTYYTLPSNDYNTVDKTVNETLQFIKSALLAERCSDYVIPDKYLDAHTELREVVIKEKWLTNEELNILDIKGEMLLYTICKAFKFKKLKDEYMRHVLSYTLDMLGKLARKDYRTKFYDFSDTCYKYLGK